MLTELWTTIEIQVGRINMKILHFDRLFQFNPVF